MCSIRLVYAAVAGACIALVGWLPQAAVLRTLAMVLAVLWWCWAIRLLIGFPDSMARPLPRLLRQALGIVLLMSCIGGLGLMHAGDNGAWRLFYVLGIVWAADIGAYFFGRTLGRHKLLPKVSPGKTVEGAIGGLLSTGVWIAVFAPPAFAPQGGQWLALSALTLAAAALSIVGDLGVSMFKRLGGVKDSGNLLPGHGGLLDRVDSLLASTPVMVLGISALGL